MATVQIYGTLPGGGGGTGNYNDLENKPSINGVTLAGNKTTADLNISAPKITFGTEDLTPGVSELEEGALYFVYE